MTADVPELRALLAKAKGPWRVRHPKGPSYGETIGWASSTHGWCFELRDAEGRDPTHFHVQTPWENRTECPPAPDNAALIAALVNEVPALLDEVERCRNSWGPLAEGYNGLMAQVDELRAALRDHQALLGVGGPTPLPDFLNWIADRIVHVYGESESIDFVISLRRRAEYARVLLGSGEDTPNGE